MAMAMTLPFGGLSLPPRRLSSAARVPSSRAALLDSQADARVSSSAASAAAAAAVSEALGGSRVSASFAEEGQGSRCGRLVVLHATRSRGRKAGGGNGNGSDGERREGRKHPDSGGADPPEAGEDVDVENAGPWRLEQGAGDEKGVFQRTPRADNSEEEGAVKAKVNGVAIGSPLFNKLKNLSNRSAAGSKERLTAASDDSEVSGEDEEDQAEEVVEDEYEDGENADSEKAEPKAEGLPREQVNGNGKQFDKDDESFNLDIERLTMEESLIKEPRFKVTLSELLDEAKVVPLSVEGDLDVTISGIQHDSRQVNPGDMFVCCIGQTVDGHKFAGQAAEQGAVVIVASKEIDIGDNVKALVMVKDTSAILSALAGAFYGRPSDNLAVVGITGTNGKTTTSYLLRSIYESMGLKTGLIGTIAYYIHGKHKQDAPHTTPDAVHLQKLMATMVHNGTEVCVMEVSSHALSQDRCKEIDFDVAVFTNLSRDHMDFHKSEEEYREAKGRLFAKMVDPARHRKVVNIDDPNASYFLAQGNKNVPVITFGMETSADVHPLDIQLSLFETELLVKTPHGNIEISSGLLGRHNVYNILAAVSVGIAVEAPLEDIVRGIEEVDSVPGRVELVDEEQAFAVIVDYAHTPDALSRLLDTVRECGPRRIITVVGCGGDRDRGKRPMMAKIAAEKSEVCIFTSDNPRSEDPLEILDDMLAGVGWTMEEYLACGEKNYYPPIWNGNKVWVYDLRKIAVRVAVAMGEEGDAVVVAGKGHEKYQIIGKEKKYHDDREECREALLHVDMLHASGIDTSEIPWKFPGHKL